MVNKTLATLMVASATAFACQAQATTIDVTDSQWHQFDVSPDSSPTSSLAWVDTDFESAGFGTPLDFKINLTGPATVTVVDAGFSGDRFNVFDNGVLLGQTSAAANNTSGDPVIDFDAALAGGFSFATFLLSAGTHDLTGVLSVSATDGGVALNTTTGGLRVAPVPLPGAALLLLSGTGLLSFVRRRRSV